MNEVRLTIRSEQGLHGRPADLFVRLANRFSCSIQVRNMTSNSEPANAKSILQVLSLGIYKGHTIHVIADGVDEDKAAMEITHLVNSDFKCLEES